MEPNGEVNWIQHAGGIGRLFEARGPHRLQSDVEFVLFLVARPIIVSISYLTQSGCQLTGAKSVVKPLLSAEEPFSNSRSGQRSPGLHIA